MKNDFFFSEHAAIKYAEDHKLGQIVKGEFVPTKMSPEYVKRIILPTTSVKEITGKIPYVSWMTLCFFKDILKFFLSFFR